MGGHTSGELIGGRYALGELLGVGGSASVYAAHDLQAAAGEPEWVALKILHPHLCADQAQRAAFLREAERAAGLHHHNLVTVRGAGLHDAAGVLMPWIAMDLVAGPTLRDHVLQSGPLSTAQTAALAEGILSGLAVAHAAGLVHRDISPQNLVFPASDGPLDPGSVRLLDFGLADASGRTTVGSDVLLAAAEGGGIIGNANYMSPEQARGLPVRTPSDLYQVGAVLYFALTGRPPFPRRTSAEVLEAHAAAPPPAPSALVPAARPFDRIITHALTKTPARRFRDATQFREAVEAALLTLEPAVPDSDASAEASEHPMSPALVASERTSVTRVLSPARGGYGVPAPPPEPLAPDRPSTSLGFLAVIGAIVVVATAGVWASLAGATSAPPEADPVPTTQATPTGEPSLVPEPVAPQASPSTTVQAVSVPQLSGFLADAEAALRAAGLTLGEVTRVDSPWVAETVLRHDPAAGQLVEPGASVAVTVASGYNAVPDVAGLDVTAGRSRLEAAGFSVSSGDAAADAVIVATRPASGVVVSVGTEVVLRTQPRSTATPTPTPAQPSPTPTGDTP